MPFFRFLYQHALWVAPPLSGVAVVMLAGCIYQIVRLERVSLLCRLPLLQQQPVDFRDPGRVILSFEGPQFTRRLSGLTAELRSADGRLVEGHRCWFRANSSGLTKSRTTWSRYDLPQAGRYTLSVHGLAPELEEHRDYSLAFSKPHLAQTVGCILGILLAAMLLIGSLVLFGLRVLERKKS